MRSFVGSTDWTTRREKYSTTSCGRWMGNTCMRTPTRRTRDSPPHWPIVSKTEPEWVSCFLVTSKGSKFLSMSVIYVDVLKESYQSINQFIYIRNFFTFCLQYCLQSSWSISNSTHYFVHGILGLLIDRSAVQSVPAIMIPVITSEACWLPPLNTLPQFRWVYSWHRADSVFA